MGKPPIVFSRLRREKVAEGRMRAAMRSIAVVAECRAAAVLLRKTALIRPLATFSHAYGTGEDALGRGQ